MNKIKNVKILPGDAEIKKWYLPDVTFNGIKCKKCIDNTIEINIKKKCYYCNKKYYDFFLYTIEYKKIKRKICKECLVKNLKL